MKQKTRAVGRCAPPLRASFLFLLLVAACQPDPDGPGTRSEAVEPSRAGPAAESSDRPDPNDSIAAAAPLPGLIAVMNGLEQDMARLSRGLWIADYDTIAAAARAVATHPKVPPSEAQQIAGVLGHDMAAFKNVDTEIHGLAVRIEELAREADLDSIVTAEARLRAGCLACHTRFRTRIRRALR
jgi:cytochrome c556